MQDARKLIDRHRLERDARPLVGDRDGCTTKEEYIERVRATDATMQQQSAAVPSAGPAMGVLDVRYCMS